MPVGSHGHVQSRDNLCDKGIALGLYKETITRYYAVCDWCQKKVETKPDALNYGFNSGEQEPSLPDGWERDWDVPSEPLTYCTQVHMDRARQVAQLRALP